MSVTRRDIVARSAETSLRSISVEVSTARFRLDATLQHLVEKKDDGNAASDGEDSVAQTDSPSVASPIQSPRKGGKSRKRKKKEDPSSFSSSLLHQPFVMKLFDRSVDMAQYEENTPLYPICRAWMHNQYRLKRDRTPSPIPLPEAQNEDGDGLENVYQLPPPVTLKTESGIPRIPIPLAQPAERLDIHKDPAQAPAPEQLLLNHMIRWKQIRNQWKDAGMLNEMRYAGSLTVLRSMYDRAGNTE